MKSLIEIENNKRISAIACRFEFIDSLRGFLIFLVVLHHTSLWGLGIDYMNAYHHYYMQFFMPLFFLISGFVGYKGEFKRSKNYIKSLLGKFRVLVVMATFFLILENIISRNGEDILIALFSGGGKYWFTYVLFYSIILLDFYWIFIGFLKIKDKYKDYLLLGFSLSFWGIASCFDNLVSVMDLSEIYIDVFNFFGGVNLKFFTFYVIGILIKKKWKYFETKFIDSSFLLICILMYLGINVIDALVNIHYGFIYTIAAFSGSIVIFFLFYKNQDFFSSNNLLGKIFQFIGKRTLDIYWLHYFFIPYTFLTIYPNIVGLQVPLVEMILSIILSIPVICASITISIILRLSPLLGFYFFGVKSSK